MSLTSTSNQTLTITKLQADGSNWSTYSEHVMNYLMSKGLKRDLIKRNGDYYKPNRLTPLSDAELEKHKGEQDEYKQKQASIREVIYGTIDNSTFIQVKNEKDATAIWKKVVSIHANKGNMYKTNLLTQLQNSHYVKGKSMQEHLTKIMKMTELKERLAEIGSPISDESFIAYICTSLQTIDP
ncbi:hypothetical protein L208DRAFT_1348074 [Tricholoma matsutake]|nr:hypothetical protein L208DRAFT_1348074 [Tricholoma matsutake 945]